MALAPVDVDIWSWYLASFLSLYCNFFCISSSVLDFNSAALFDSSALFPLSFLAFRVENCFPSPYEIKTLSNVKVVAEYAETEWGSEVRSEICILISVLLWFRRVIRLYSKIKDSFEWAVVVHCVSVKNTLRGAVHMSVVFSVRRLRRTRLSCIEIDVLTNVCVCWICQLSSFYIRCADSSTRK